MVSLRELFADLAVAIDGPEVEVRSLTCDSRSVTAGACFAALPGARADGITFVPQAIAQGAASVLCERPVDTGGAARVLVKDARRALAAAARRFYGDPAARLTLVGVTGTNGKTTTTHLVEGVLAAAGRAAAVIGTLGYRYGDRRATTGLTTPESVDLVALLAEMAAAGTMAVAMEVSSHALAQHRVSGVDFDVGVFTNLTHDHLDYHGTMEAYFAAKALLFETRLKAGGRAVLNLDDPFARRLVRAGTLAFSAGGREEAAIRVRELRLGSDGIGLVVATPRGDLALRSPLVGAFNVENILAAVAVGEALGLGHDAISGGIAGVAAVPGRLERISAESEPLVVVDYAHTPDALEKVLTTVRAVVRGRVLCVFGCGGDRDPKKRGPMGGVAARFADWAVLTSDNPRSESPAVIAAAVEEGLRGAGARRSDEPGRPGYAVELDRAAAIRRAIDAAADGDAVVIAGKGHETYQIVGTITRHFDDREEARAALSARTTRRRT